MSCVLFTLGEHSVKQPNVPVDVVLVHVLLVLAKLNKLAMPRSPGRLFGSRGRSLRCTLDLHTLRGFTNSRAATIYGSWRNGADTAPSGLFVLTAGWSPSLWQVRNVWHTVLRLYRRDFFGHAIVLFVLRRVIKWLVDVGGLNRHVFELLQQNFTVVAKKADNYSKMS